MNTRKYRFILFFDIDVFENRIQKGIFFLIKFALTTYDIRSKLIPITKYNNYILYLQDGTLLN